jgi:hypothetical protein
MNPSDKFISPDAACALAFLEAARAVARNNEGLDLLRATAASATTFANTLAQVKTKYPQSEGRDEGVRALQQVHTLLHDPNSTPGCKFVIKTGISTFSDAINAQRGTSGGYGR